MIKRKLIFFFSFFFISFSYAQNDSLSIFRTNQINTNKSGARNTGFLNAIFINFNHVTRGGISICYERFFVQPYISIYGGYGVSYYDIAGQYSLNESFTFTNPNDYSSLSADKPGRIIDLGLKFLDVTMWDNAYLGFGYTFVSNHLKRKIDNEFQVENNEARTYKLDKISNEIKLVLGFLNDDTRRFYFDAAVGPGLRLLSYEELDINDDPLMLNGLTQQSGQKVIGVNKVDKIAVKIWLFLGLKLGLKF